MSGDGHSPLASSPTSAEHAPFTGAPGPGVRGAVGARGRARRGADAGVQGQGRRRVRPAAVHDRAHRRDHDRALEAPLRRAEPASGSSSSSASRERWASTTTNFRWAQADALVPAFEGSTEFELVVPCTYDLELAAAKYFNGLADGVAPLRFHFNGTVFYEADDGRMQIVQVPWDRSPRFEMPVEVWREAIDAVYPYRAWVPVDTATLERLQRRKAERGLPTFDAVARRAARRGGGLSRARAARAARLVAALRGLRALPVHARRDQERDPDPVRDRLPAGVRRGSCRPRSTTCGSTACSPPSPRPSCRATVRFLQAAGERHRAHERRLELRAAALDELGDGVGQEFAFEGAQTLRGRARIRCERLEEPGLWRVRACVHNTTEVEPGPRALRRPGGQPALDARGRGGVGGSLRLAARARRRRRGRGAGRAERQHLPGARRAGRRRDPRRDDRAPRPSATRAREPRQPVRQHRDRGGAAAARPGALGRRARGDRRAGPGGQADGRARRAGDARRAAGPARNAARARPKLERDLGSARARARATRTRARPSSSSTASSSARARR